MRRKQVLGTYPFSSSVEVGGAAHVPGDPSLRWICASGSSASESKRPHSTSTNEGLASATSPPPAEVLNERLCLALCRDMDGPASIPDSTAAQTSPLATWGMIGTWPFRMAAPLGDLFPDTFEAWMLSPADLLAGALFTCGSVLYGAFGTYVEGFLEGTDFLLVDVTRVGLETFFLELATG